MQDSRARSVIKRARTAHTGDNPETADANAFCWAWASRVQTNTHATCIPHHMHKPHIQRQYRRNLNIISASMLFQRIHHNSHRSDAIPRRATCGAHRLPACHTHTSAQIHLTHTHIDRFYRVYLKQYRAHGTHVHLLAPHPQHSFRPAR